MAENMPTGPVETGADMDYSEHEKTYATFVSLAKYSSIVCAAIMIAMAFGFFAGGGFIASTVLFLIVVALAAYILR
ncbi:aa3-type cytochrome c oxidase subunit IV [Nitratireductor sp. CAU 1489]|uniref:Aa3-type cytochrome c oxidase subunit IV n=1 Tax=Nitratireductor arenosus TaxID=2682096 RepID=A0A844Q9S6_9HYPH|nr:aa3-type cytochrome c oxidase subunit IV [Nitratireductor arenosus]MVA95892.1 aa3-type cytochrome c oxidase subunit IV [Nitratireductor arenosus]